jgi:hypothetical protein
VEPSHDIAFTREVGAKVGFMMDGCSDLSVPASQELSPIRSGHKDERINRRKLTSGLVQLEFASKRNMHCPAVLTSTPQNSEIKILSSLKISDFKHGLS